MPAQGGVYDFSINTDESWPPRGELQLPIGPTQLEVLRSCPLRIIFLKSGSTYVHRLGYAARIGRAFHAALQALPALLERNMAMQQLAELARDIYKKHLHEELEKARENPRESRLPMDRARSSRAEEAFVLAAIGMASAPRAKRPLLVQERGKPNGPQEDFQKKTILETGTTLLEVPVKSTDGLFIGRIDRVEVHDDGAWIIDYKLADQEDLPERYARQVQMYASMWRDGYGDWPTGATVVYPLSGSKHSVDVSPQACGSTLQDARSLLNEVIGSRADDVGKLARPGDVCTVCEFRPWCQPFWRYQETQFRTKESFKCASVGIETTVKTIKQVRSHWKVGLDWDGRAVGMTVPIEEAPQLSSVKQGVRLRILDAELKGLRQRPTMEVSPYTEVYLVE